MWEKSLCSHQQSDIEFPSNNQNRSFSQNNSNQWCWCNNRSSQANHRNAISKQWDSKRNTSKWTNIKRQHDPFCDWFVWPFQCKVSNLLAIWSIPVCFSFFPTNCFINQFIILCILTGNPFLLMLGNMLWKTCVFHHICMIFWCQPFFRYQLLVILSIFKQWKSWNLFPGWVFCSIFPLMFKQLDLWHNLNHWKQFRTAPWRFLLNFQSNINWKVPTTLFSVSFKWKTSSVLLSLASLIICLGLWTFSCQCSGFVQLCKDLLYSSVLLMSLWFVIFHPCSHALTHRCFCF